MPDGGTHIALSSGRLYEFEDGPVRFVATFERVDHDVRLDPPDDWQVVSVYYFADRVPYATASPMTVREVTS